MRFALAALLLAACYKPDPPAAVPCGTGDPQCPSGQSCHGGFCFDDDNIPVDATPDGDPNCPIGDNICLVACLFKDTDCSSTCGDGRCVGNAGEMCGTCPTDCAKSGPLCGNGECSPGEAPDCFADCGPVPWSWDADEQALITLVNNVRTAGHQCPNDTMPVTRPAFIIDDSMKAGAREWVWEIAHENVFITGGAACNMRTLAQRQMQYGGFTQYIQSRGAASPQAVFDSWMANATICPIVMGTNTKLSIAIAVDKTRGYVFLSK